MDRDDSLNIQNEFFNQARKEKARVLIFLNSGRKLTGRIKSFDKFTIILENGQGELMIFKHAIATIANIKTFGNYMSFGGPGEKDREPSGPGPETGEGEGSPPAP